jgi:hypothetical protein
MGTDRDRRSVHCGQQVMWRGWSLQGMCVRESAELGMVVHICNPSTLEAEARGSQV